MGSDPLQFVLGLEDDVISEPFLSRIVFPDLVF